MTQSFNFNDLLAKAEAAGGTTDLLPKGPYTLRVEEAESKPSSNGKPMIKVKFAVIGGPYDGKWVWNNFVLSQENETALRIFFEQMKVFGLDADFFRGISDLSQAASAMVGSVVDATIDHRPYNGQTYADVKKIKPAGSPQPAAAAPSLGAVPQVPSAGPPPSSGPAAVPAPPVIPQPATPPAAPATPPAPPF